MPDWYEVSGAPSTGSFGSSATIRSEFELIQTAMAKLPTLTGNGSKLTAVNSAGTAMEALTAANARSAIEAPYDLAFVAGFDPDMVKEDVAAAVYGELAVARPGTFIGESGYADTAPTGQALIVDIKKNGTSIYTSLPQFGAASQTLSAGTIKSDGTQNFVAGDRITFEVTQVGSSEPGEGVRFTAKAKLTG